MKFIVLNGPPRCGKDTAQRLLPGYKAKFSLPLKFGVAGMFDPMGLALEGLEATKDQPSPTLMGSTFRQEQIELFHYLATRFGQDVLGKLLLKRLEPLRRQIEQEHGDLVTISDGGRRAEYFPLIEKEGKENMLVVQIRRNGTSFTDNRQWCDLSDVGVKTLVVENNGTEQEFERELVSRINGAVPGWIERLI